MTDRGLTVGQWVIPDAELEERFDTPGGPGGQHANRNATAVTLRVDLTNSSLPAEVRDRLTSRLGEIAEVTASDSRSQWRNRAMARQRLQSLLEGALKEPTQRRPTRPGRAARERRIKEKKARGEKKRLRKPPDIE